MCSEVQEMLEVHRTHRPCRPQFAYLRGGGTQSARPILWADMKVRRDGGHQINTNHRAKGTVKMGDSCQWLRDHSLCLPTPYLSFSRLSWGSQLGIRPKIVESSWDLAATLCPGSGHHAVPSQGEALGEKHKTLHIPPTFQAQTFFQGSPTSPPGHSALPGSAWDAFTPHHP